MSSRSPTAQGAPAGSARAERTYADLQLIAHAPALFNGIVAALELGLIDHLIEHPGAALDDLRTSIEVPEHQLRVLLLVLCALGLADRGTDGRYHASEIAARELASGRTDSWRHIFLSRHRTDYHGLAHATSALRAGTNTGLAVHPGSGDTLYERLAGDAAVMARLYDSITAFTERTAPALIEHPELASVRHLLDIGGGSGAISKRYVARYPQAQATVFDSPSVVELAAGDLDDATRARVHFRGGDLRSDQFPAGADAVLFCHVLEVFPPEDVPQLLRRAWAALPSGGRVLIYAFTAPDAEDGGVLAAQLSLYLNVLATGTGMAYPAANFATWLGAAGCTDIVSYQQLPYEHSLIVGRKP